MAGFYEIFFPNRSRCFSIHSTTFGGIGRGTKIGQRGHPILTDAKCRAAKDKDKPYKLSDAHGLYLFVSTSGHRSWRWNTRIAGREKVLTIGTFAAVTKIWHAHVLEFLMPIEERRAFDQAH